MSLPTIRLRRLSITGEERAWAAIEAVFVANAEARRGPLAGAERDGLLRAWLDPYRAHWPDLVWIAEDADGTLAGYLTGCLDSRGAMDALTGQEGYSLFADLFEAYPAHFHVNCRPGRQGRGIGAALVAAFVAHCRARRVPGVHAVTTKAARNVAFYRRLGFAHAVARKAGDRDLLFLGKALSPEPRG